MFPNYSALTNMLEILELADKMGFKVVSSKLCAADFGVSQVRYRAFLVGCKFADPSLVFPPKKDAFQSSKWKSARFWGVHRESSPMAYLEGMKLAICLRPKRRALDLKPPHLICILGDRQDRSALSDIGRFRRKG